MGLDCVPKASQTITELIRRTPFGKLGAHLQHKSRFHFVQNSAIEDIFEEQLLGDAVLPRIFLLLALSLRHLGDKQNKSRMKEQEIDSK